MAELVVSSLLPVLFGKLESNLAALMRLTPIESQLYKWKTTLDEIRSVLENANLRNANEGDRRWLTNLEHLSYEIEDILNELVAEVMRRRRKEESYASSTTKKVSMTIPTYVADTMYDRKMVARIDVITVELRLLFEKRGNLGLTLIDQIPNRMVSSVELNEPGSIMGREGDKEVLLKTLLGNQNVNVVSIAGMGGIGKTTMARLLFNNDQVKDYFEPMAWFHFSNDPNRLDAYHTLFQFLVGNNQHLDDRSLLPHSLTGKRFLFVFDNVWNFHKFYNVWEELELLFYAGEPGSKIIVTTRNSEITYVTPSDEVYPLKCLSNEAALSLFAQEALGEKSFDSHPTFKLYAEGILKKCDGSPLALGSLGRLLRTSKDEEDWKKVLNSEIRDLDDDIGILSSLRASYYDLSAPMKRVFAYCSFFPRGYVFDRAELVLLWMAEGFLSGSDGGRSSMESLGDRYLEHLVSMAFFQHSTNEETRYTMHNLIHELAISVAQDFFFLLDDEKKDINGSSKKFHFHHLSFIRQQYGVNLGLLRETRRLRTFLAMPLRVEVDEGQRFHLSHRDLRRLLRELQFLRVLSLTGYSITKIPRSIGSLKNIRYLNFSQTDIECLPEQVCELYHLQSLLLHGCKNLHSLPKSFVKLKNLTHLDISNTSSLNKLPLGIGGLTNLQTLSKVIIDEANGFKISNLKDLVHLQGRLSIEGLHNVKNAKQAQEANLQQKYYLDDLVMEWSAVFDNSQKERRGEYDILHELRPHWRLKNLEILFYGGMEFPSWVGDRSFDRLTQIKLCGCEGCPCLPTLGHLKSLRKLFVESMNSVKALGNEFLGTYDCPFASLEILEFKNMEGWKKWSFKNGRSNIIAASFPCLREISLINCPKLVVESNQSIPSLGFFRIERCSEEVLRSIIRMCPSTVRLTMESIEGLAPLNGEVLQQLGAVQYLCIAKCHELRYLWESESAACNVLANLQNLEVRSCKKLELIEKEVSSEISLNSVTEVSLFNCERLKSYNCPESIRRLVINDCHLITSLIFPTVPPGLKILDIRNCPMLEENWLSNDLLSGVESLEIHKWSNLKSFPVGCFVHMKKLIIRGCDNIKSIPEEGFGDLPLRCLEIISCRNMERFPHAHLLRLQSLVELSVTNCPSMDDNFPCGLWPPNLKSLRIGRLKRRMSNWGNQAFPTSLVNLCLLGENSGVVSFAKVTEDAPSSFLLPSSLTSLEIIGFRSLESLSEGLQHLTSLKQLVIESCSNVADLPETLLPSLTSLKVSSSLKLQKRCRDKSGNYQDLISHIPELDV